MGEMSTQAWAIFRRIRIVLFLIALILSVVWVVFYVLLVAEDWQDANNLERGLVLTLATINTFGIMFWYLMIVLLFQPKAEAARISCFLVIQTGGTIAFAIFRNKFSCRVFNTRSTCEMAASIVVYAGWGVSGLALLYLFFLALMSYVQYPTPDNPDGTVFDHLETERDRVEASGGQLLLDENTLKTENQEQDPKHQSYYSAAAQSSLAFDLRPPSVRTSEYYFPSRPDSTYSASSRYLRAPERAIPAEEAIAGPSSSALEPVQYGGSRLLPNPFDEPISRDNTLMSLLSDSSSVYGYGVGNGKRTLPRRPEETMSRTLSGRSERYHPPPPYVNESQIAIASPDKTQLVIIPKVDGSLRSGSFDSLNAPVPSHRGFSIHSTAGSFHPTVSLPPTPVSNLHRSPTLSGIESPPLTSFHVLRADSPTLPPVPEVPTVDAQVKTRSPLQRHSSMPARLSSQDFRPSRQNRQNERSSTVPIEEWKKVVLDAANGRPFPA